MPPYRNCLAGLLVLGLALTTVAAAPLRVGLDVNGEPMTFVDSKGVPRGFAVEIMNGLAAEMGFQVEYVPKPWAEMLSDFQAGKTDALANITYTDERTKFVEYSVPNIVMNGAIFVRKGDHAIKTLSDLRHERVAAKIGGSPYQYLAAHGWADHIVPTATLRDSLRALAEGRADAALDARIIGLKTIRDEHLASLEAADVPVLDFAQRLHIGLHPGDSVRLALINEGLARLRANGSYDRIYDKWIEPLDPQRLRFRQLSPFLLPAAALFSLMLGAFLWQRAILRDLREAQTALAREEAQFRFIYEHAPVGLSWLKGDRGHTRVVNKAHERITGVTAERSHETANYVAATHPDDRETQRRLRDRMDRGEIDQFVMEKRYIHPDGKIVWGMLSVHVYHDPAGGVAEELATLVDISNLKTMEHDRQELQQKMVEAQKLESLGVLAGGIAHDFNNLLTVIIANISLIRAAGDEPTREERLHAVDLAGHRAAELCRQMLTYAGKGSYVVEAVEISELVRETAKLLEVSISKKAHLVLQLGAALPRLEADASQIRQVVMNLVINASDALGDGCGEIRVSTFQGKCVRRSDAVVHAFGPTMEDGVCIEVRDTGQGMDPATLQRIFEPFFTTKFTGRGLGLAAVLGIIRSCRGTLVVESTLREGTVFRIHLPVNSSGVRTKAMIVSGGAAVGPALNRTILVADDEPEVLATIEALLRHQGYHTVGARNGPEAVSRFVAAPDSFAAAIVDLTMPGLDGSEVLRKIQAVRPGTPVLLTSGYSSQAVLDRLRGLPPCEILQKPFTRGSLMESLAKVLAAAPASSPVA
jgi:PAS domain S-box-containing protein